MSRAVGITVMKSGLSHDGLVWLRSQGGPKEPRADARDDYRRRLQAKIGEMLMEECLLYAKVDPAWRPAALWNTAEVERA